MHVGDKLKSEEYDKAMHNTLYQRRFPQVFQMYYYSSNR